MNENWDLTQGVDEIQLLKEKVEALTEIVHNPNFVLIVRCGDCIHYSKYGCGIVEGLTVCRSESFCSYGERRKDNDT